MNTIYTKADIHIHTTYSDGTAGVAAVLEHVARSTDLRLIAITDHDVIAGALLARQMAREFGIEVIVGEEVSTAEGHMLALFIERWVPPGRPMAETIAAVHAQGGLCVVAHPFDTLVDSAGANRMRQNSRGPRTGNWQLDGIEAFNAGSWIAASNRQAERFGMETGLARCGGSDSHTLGTLGRGYTLFPGASADDLYRAIVSGQTASGGARWSFGDYAEVAAYRSRERWQRWRGQNLPSHEVPGRII